MTSLLCLNELTVYLSLKTNYNPFYCIRSIYYAQPVALNPYVGDFGDRFEAGTKI